MLVLHDDISTVVLERSQLMEPISARRAWAHSHTHRSTCQIHCRQREMAVSYLMDATMTDGQMIHVKYVFTSTK